MRATRLSLRRGLALFATGLLALAPLPAAAQSLDYGLLEQLFGEPVTTSATGTPQRATDVPANMDIVTAEDIRRSGAADIPGVLQHVLGVDVLRWTPFAADVSVRGYDSPYTPRLLVLLNGRQVYLDDYGHTVWDAIPVELPEIRQIEVIKGPNSALFGFNAAGGVVNIITDNPLYDRLNTAVLRAGTDDFGQASVVGTAHVGERAAVRLSAGGLYGRDLWPVNPSATPGPLRDTALRGSVAADGHVRVGASGDLELEATHVHVGQRDMLPFLVFSNDDTEVSSIRARYTASTPLGVIDADAYTNFANIRIAVPGVQDNPVKNQLTVAQLQDTFKLGSSSTARLSLEYRHSSINVMPTGSSTIAYDIGSAGSAWTWQALPSLALTAAVRVDALWLQRSGPPVPGTSFSNAQWQRNILEPSFNLGAVYKIGDADTLRAMVGRGVQLPSLLDLGGLNIRSGPFLETGTPTLNPTAVTNYELDWDHAIPSLSASLRTAVFYQVTTDIGAGSVTTRVQQLSSGLILSVPQNIGSSDEVGAELSAKGTLPGGWRWRLGYSPRFVRDHFDPGLSFANTGVDFRHTTPEHVIDTSVGWTGGRWEIDGFTHYQSSFYGLLTTNYTDYALRRVNNYISVDARVAYHLTDAVTVSVAGQDFLFHTQQQTALSTAQRRIIGSLALQF